MTEKGKKKKDQLNSSEDTSSNDKKIKKNLKNQGKIKILKKILPIMRTKRKKK